MIHWGFEILEKLLHPTLWASIHTTYCNPNSSSAHESDGITFFNGHTGDLLFRSPRAIMRRVTRQKLRRLLSEGLDIRWNMEVESLDVKDEGDQGVNIEFKDGYQVTADMVLGADGPRSTVRRILLGEDKASCTQSDFVCGYTSTVLGSEKADMVLKAHPIWTMAYHSSGVCATGGKSVTPVCAGTID